MSKQGEGKIDRLRKNIRQHDILYYVKDSPIISDREYDLLMRELQDLEGKFSEFIWPASQTLNSGQSSIAIAS